MSAQATADARAVARAGGGLLPMLPLWLWWAAWTGGYPPSVFLAAIPYLAAVAVALTLSLGRPRLTGPRAVALAALAGLTLWTFLSVGWAADRGAAELAVARQVLALASFALPLLWPPGERCLLAGAAALPAVALLGLATALAEARAEGLDALLDGRLIAPTGYANATAALMAIGALPALVLASERELGPPLRVAGLAAGGVLLGGFVLTQSRGGVVVLAVAALVALALARRRLRLVVPAAIAVLGVLMVLDPLLEVRSAAVGEGGSVDAAIDDALLALVLEAAVLAVAGAAYVRVDRRVSLPVAVVRRASHAAAAIALTLAAAAVAAFAVAHDDPGGWVDDRIEDFKTPEYAELESQGSRFGGELGSNRYDYWRVSVDVFADRPLTGNGAANFLAPFLERREAEKATLYSHSIWLAAMAELGAPGLLLLLGFVGALGAALARPLRRGPPERSALALAVTLPLVYALLHASVDWIRVYPVVFAPALALAAAGAAIPGAAGVARRRGAGWWVAAGLVLATVAAVPLLISVRLSDRGATTWPERGSAALEDLELAADLDPLAAAPLVRRGVVAIDLGRPAVAHDSFVGALERDPSAWYPRLALGLLAARRGDRSVALAWLAGARARNPGDRVLRRAERAVAAGRSPGPAAVQRLILGQLAPG